MKTITWHCDVCGSPTAAPSILAATAGELRSMLPDELCTCPECSGRLVDFIRAGRPTIENDLPQDPTPQPLEVAH